MMEGLILLRVEKCQLCNLPVWHLSRLLMWRPPRLAALRYLFLSLAYSTFQRCGCQVTLVVAPRLSCRRISSIRLQPSLNRGFPRSLQALLTPLPFGHYTSRLRGMLRSLASRRSLVTDSRNILYQVSVTVSIPLWISTIVPLLIENIAVSKYGTSKEDAIVST